MKWIFFSRAKGRNSYVLNYEGIVERVDREQLFPLAGVWLYTVRRFKVFGNRTEEEE